MLNSNAERWMLKAWAGLGEVLEVCRWSRWSRFVAGLDVEGVGAAVDVPSF